MKLGLGKVCVQSVCQPPQLYACKLQEILHAPVHGTSVHFEPWLTMTHLIADIFSKKKKNLHPCAFLLKEY